MTVSVPQLEIGYVMHKMVQGLYAAFLEVPNLALTQALILVHSSYLALGLP